MSRGDVKCIAADEDDAIVWFARTASCWKVRRQSAADWMRARWLVAESMEMLVVPAPVLEVKRSHIGKLPASS